VPRFLEKSYAYGFLVGKPKGKRPLGTSWHIINDNIEINLWVGIA
jgi:hypothetical protein